MKIFNFFSCINTDFGTDGGEGSAAFTSPELQALFDQYGRRLTAKGNILLNIPSAGARIIIDADNVDTFARALASRYLKNNLTMASRSLIFDSKHTTSQYAMRYKSVGPVVYTSPVNIVCTARNSRCILSTGYISVQNMSLIMSIRDMQAL